MNLVGLAIALFLGAVAGAVLGEVIRQFLAPHTKKRWFVPAALIGALLFLVVQAALENTGQSESAQEVPAESTIATETSGEPIPNATPPSEPETMATSLTDLPTVEQDTTSSIDLGVVSPISINGGNYGRALTYSCYLFCDGGSPQILEVTLGGKFSRFMGTAAVLDTASGEYRIDITLDGGAPQSFIVVAGTPQGLDMDVSGVSRMRIEFYAPAPLKNPLQAGADSAVGENGVGLPGIAIGDPLLLP